MMKEKLKKVCFSDKDPLILEKAVRGEKKNLRLVLQFHMYR